MTLGEKIRQARKNCDLSQEQLAQKLCVSRSAVAKWETGKGLPDVENLRMLSRLLQVSVDSLLDDGAVATVIREGVCLDGYGRGCKRIKKNRMMREKYPGARIWHLLGRLELANAERTEGDSVGFLTTAPFGTPERICAGEKPDREFYLVEMEEKQLFVAVSDEYMEARVMDTPLSGSDFCLGDWHFIRSNYVVD